jgi:hypothetical protein
VFFQDHVKTDNIMFHSWKGLEEPVFDSEQNKTELLKYIENGHVCGENGIASLGIDD